MAVNSSTLTDEDGDYSDWIELYNTTSSEINLSGWTLTDEMGFSDKWTFPNISIPAYKYLLVFASDKNQAEIDKELHTNFKLSGDGEYLALFKYDGTIVSEINPSYPAQQTDISYVFYNGEYISTLIPTPGSENVLSGIDNLPPPQFSEEHGFFENQFDIDIKSTLTNSSIIYTIDGSEPDFENGNEYAEPFTINSTTVLRAITVFGELKSKITTATYLFLDDVIKGGNNPPGYPTEWGPYTEIDGNGIADYEMDWEIIRDSKYNQGIIEGLLQIPTMSIVTDKKNLFSHSTDSLEGGIYIYTGPPEGGGYGLGKDWERPASVEYFNYDGSESFQINCGLQLHGGHSRRVEKTPKHSFKLLFKSEYGPSKLNYPLFGEDATDSFNSIVLRAGYGNSILHSNHSERKKFQLIRDKFAKDTQLAMGHPAGSGNYVHLYLNGIYWGIYNPTERINDDFAETYLGGSSEDYDIIKDNAQVIKGNKNAWNEMMAIANGGLIDNVSYQLIQGNNPDGTPNDSYENYLDLENFIDYMLINYYGTNWDWDSHNWIAVRNRHNPGKGFKFFSWDAEHIIEAIDDNKLNLNNYDRPSRLFQKLKENQNFRKLFADRVQLHFKNKGALSPEKNIERWMKNANQIDMAVIAETARWGDYRRDVHPWRPGQTFDLYDKSYWDNELEFITTQYFPQRGDIFIQQLREAGLFPNAEAPSFLVNNKQIENNIVELGDELSIVSTSGDIYFTINGEDPALSNNIVELEEIVLVEEDSEKKVLIPTQDIGNNWRSINNFNVNDWLTCSGQPGGIGYENSSGYEEFITLDLSNQMQNNNSCYVRIIFNINNITLDNYNSLILEMLYDDGFIAYLNGSKIAEENVSSTVSWNSSANSGLESSGYVSFDISNFLSDLKSGDNLLAIHAMNSSLSSSDFILNTRLKISKSESNKALSENAILYTKPIEINSSINIKARTFDNNEWSALRNEQFVVNSNFENLKITEIHYNPLNNDTLSGKMFEFIELKNIGETIIEFAGSKFTDGIYYNFKVGDILLPKQFLVLASDSLSFIERYGFSPFAQFDGNLSNDGERIEFVSASTDTVISMEYNDKDPWPTQADGEGYSLVYKLLNPAGDPSNGSNWKHSLNIHGSPGKDDEISTNLSDSEIVFPNKFRLKQNYPNPFNPVTTIEYTVPLEAEMFVRLEVFDVLGREVATLVEKKQKPGNYTVEFNCNSGKGRYLASGLYYYRIKAGDFVKTKKMLLLK